MFREIESKEILVLGCGNVLFGDDAFGPAVIEKLLALGQLPEHVHAEDVGTSIRDVLFNIALADPKPRRVIVVDAVDLPGRVPGEVFELKISDLPEIKMPDFSYHQFPTTNLLRELKEEGEIDVRIIATQAAHIPDHVSQGLSAAVTQAVEDAARQILEMCNWGS